MTRLRQAPELTKALFERKLGEVDVAFKLIGEGSQTTLPMAPLGGALIKRAQSASLVGITSRREY
ncbi:MAG: hypothetical protein ACKVPX_12230, partial [Myxococcaceae bacterium]